MYILNAIIESTENNYSAYIENLDGVVATGTTITEIREKLINAVDDYVKTCLEMKCEMPEGLKDGDYCITFKMDIKSLLSVYSGIFTKAGLERITGINQKQLWHYAKGISTPRRAQVVKIENALHRLGNELISLSL